MDIKLGNLISPNMDECVTKCYYSDTDEHTHEITLYKSDILFVFDITPDGTIHANDFSGWDYIITDPSLFHKVYVHHTPAPLKSDALYRPTGRVVLSTIGKDIRERMLFFSNDIFYIESLTNDGAIANILSCPEQVLIPDEDVGEFTEVQVIDK